MIARDEERDVDRRLWHIGKEVPVAIILAIAVQTFGAVWWFANLSAKVDNIDSKVMGLTQSSVTAAEARGATEINQMRNIEQDRRISELEKEMRNLSQQHQQMMMMFRGNNGGRR